jgi:hypothetical protein
MRFKRSYTTAQATRKLGVEKRTLWKWGEGEAPKVRMYREGVQQIRIFDADEIDALAPRIKRNVSKGISLFPEKPAPSKRKNKTR